MSKFIISVDPGTEPGVTVMRSPTNFESYKIKKDNDDFNYEGFEDILTSKVVDHIEVIYIEDVHSVYGASAKANFQFGRSIGIIRGIIESNYIGYSIPITLVQPKAWQKVVRLPEDVVKGDTKATALNTVKRILGEDYSDELFLPTKRSKVPNHDMIDSYLLAYYGYLKMKEDE